MCPCEPRLVSAYDDHGATGLACDGQSDRSQQKAGEGAATARADDHHVRMVGFTQQHGFRVVSQDLCGDVEVRVAQAGTFDRGPDDVVCEYFPGGTLQAQPECRVLITLPAGGVHQTQRQFMEGSLIHRPVECQEARVRSVHTDDQGAHHRPHRLSRISEEVPVPSPLHRQPPGAGTDGVHRLGSPGSP